MLRVFATAIGTVTALGLIGAWGVTVPVEAKPATHPLIAVSNQTSDLGNGTYLYGQSQRPGEARNTYLVFEVKNSQVVGAVFMPNSSYDCFRGSLQDGTINATVTDSYEQTNYAATVDLASLYPHRQIAANAQSLLNSCQADTANSFQATAESNIAQNPALAQY